MFAGIQRPRNTVSLASSVILGADRSIRRALVERRVDAVLKIARFFGRRLGVPAMAWMADSQHRALPQAFSGPGYWKRELGFRAQIGAGREVILSSRDAQRACEETDPASAGHTHVVHFATPPPAPMSFDEARRIADGYGLPQEFVPAQPVLAAQESFDGRTGHGPSQGTRLPSCHRRVGQAGRSAQQGSLRGGRRGHRVARDRGSLPHPRDDSLSRRPRRAHALVHGVHQSIALRRMEHHGGGGAVRPGAPPPLVRSGRPSRTGRRSGIVFQSRPSAQLADAIQRFVPSSREERERRAAEARVDAEARVREFAANFVATVERCVARRSA